MVDPTPHWGIHRWDDTAPAAPLEDFFNTQADDLEAALDGAATGWYLQFATKSAMDGAPGTHNYQHATVYADSTTSNNGSYQWSTSLSKWVRAVPTTFGVSTTLGSNALTNQTSYAPFPNATDAGDLLTTFTKGFVGTKLIVSAFVTAALTSGAAQNPTLGVRIDSTDYGVDTTAQVTATSYAKLHGILEIDGLAAGAHTITLVFKASAASTYALQNRAGYSVTETN